MRMFLKQVTASLLLGPASACPRNNHVKNAYPPHSTVRSCLWVILHRIYEIHCFKEMLLP